MPVSPNSAIAQLVLSDRILIKRIDTDPQGFSAVERQEIINALIKLYSVPDAATIFDKLNSSAEPLTISKTSAGSFALINDFQVFINFNDVGGGKMTKTGQIFATSLERLLIHEIIHAVEGLEDTVKVLTGKEPVAPEEYKGETVVLTNEIMSVLNEPERASYSATFSSLLVGSEIYVGPEAETVLRATENSSSPNGATTSPGANLKTFRNVEGLKDLLIGIFNTKEIFSGAGDDRIFGGDGSTKIVAGQGDDYIDAGFGMDTISYEHIEGSFGPAPSEGIRATVHDQGGVSFARISDGFGTMDTAINFEAILATDFDDIIELTGNFSPLAFNLSGEIDAGSQVSSGDWLMLNLVDGVTADLTEQSISFEGNTVKVLNFENVSGSEFDDVLYGDEFGNILIGGEGADEILGGAGNDVIHFDGDDSLVDGGSDYDIAVATGAIGNVGELFDLTDNEFEAYVGSEQNDHAVATHSSTDTIFLLGGAGNDTLSYLPEEVASGPFDPGSPVNPVVLIGGEGNDEFILNSIGGILVIEADLGEENFQNFSFEALNFDPGFFQAVIVNPDAGDTITLSYSSPFGSESEDELHVLDVGTYGDYLEDVPSSQYSTFINPTFDGTGQNLGNYVWSGNPNILGGGIEAQGHWLHFEGYPLPLAPDGPHSQDPAFANSWYIVGAEIAGTTIDSSKGQNLPNYVFGSDGDDSLDGGLGDDWFSFGGGSNSYSGGSGFNSVSYGGISGILTVNLSTGSGTVSVNNEVSTENYSEIQSIVGSLGDDWIIGSDAANSLAGGSGADSIDGGAGDDELEGDSGNDLLTGGTGIDIFSFKAGDGNDTISDFDVDEETLTINGVEFDVSQQFFSTTEQIGSDVLVTYGVDPIFQTSGGSILLSNVSLEDWLNGAIPSIVNGTASQDIFDITYVDADGDSIDDSGQIILAGGGKDLIYDGAGDDTVEGGAGRDQFHAGGGADLYDGGAGRDEVFYTTANEGLTIDTIDGTNGTGIAAGDTFVDIEILHGSEFNDVITSDLVRTFGGNGDDTIYGSSGIDTLDGGAGMDELNGNDGADVLNGNGGADVLNGNNGADVLNGNGDADELNGGAGTDELNGGAGADVLNGGDNADTLNGGNGADVLNAGNGLDVLNGGNGADTLNGGAGADVLNAGNGADMLNGGNGVDEIKGGAGNDVLTGGAGLDVFIFEDGFGKDTITDFSTFNQEDIDLSAVSQIVDFADLTANHMTQVGSDVVIDDGAGNTITIQGFGLSDLQAGDFLF